MHQKEQQQDMVNKWAIQMDPKCLVKIDTLSFIVLVAQSGSKQLERTSKRKTDNL